VNSGPEVPVTPSASPPKRSGARAAPLRRGSDSGRSAFWRPGADPRRSPDLRIRRRRL